MPKVTHQPKGSVSRLRLYVRVLVAALLVLGVPAGLVQAAPQGAPYIIVFKETVDPTAAAPGLAQAFGLQTGYVYRHALQGMSAVVPAGRVVALQRDPRVVYVVQDMLRTIDAQTVPTGIRRIYADTNASIDIDGADDFRVDVDVAVIDTGIDLEHPDLNVVSSTSCLYSSGGGPPWRRSYSCGAGGDDDHYHGTHVAGTIAAIDNGSGVVGVAPGARVWAVKVCDSGGSCPSSAIIAGIDHVAANAASIEVANMSLGGGGFNQAEYDAIQGAVDAGVAFAVSAGNEDDNADNYSPGGFDNVLSVSALADFDGLPGGTGSPTCRADEDDTLANFSNWGPEVDIAAPGVCIYSTFPIEQGGYGTISGTSMASPHVAGALALLASANNPGNASDVTSLYNQVVNAGNSNWTDDSGDGIQEPLLDVSTFVPTLVETGGGGTNNPPTADFTVTTADLTASFTDASTDSDGTLSAWSWDFGDGNTSTAQNPSHSYAAGGTYTVELTVTDDEGATDTVSKPVTVSSGGGGTMHVAEITMGIKQAGRNRFINTTVKIVDATNSPVADATVELTLTLPDGSTVSLSGATGSDGTVTLGVKSGQTGTFESTVTNVTHASLSYDPASNVETSDSIIVP